MKQLKILLAATVLLLTFGLSSCNQNNPSEADLFTGKYIGNVTYIKTGEGGKTITDDDVTITVIKVGNNYDFHFSHNIPSITGVEMKKNDDSLVTIGTDGLKIIKITGEKLNISYTTDEGSWTVIAKRK